VVKNNRVLSFLYICTKVVVAMGDHDQLQKRARWMPGIFIFAGVAVILIAFFVYVLKEATFHGSLENYVAVKNPTADAGLIILLGSFIVLGVALISMGLFAWGRK
jgi:hypothetical protein